MLKSPIEAFAPITELAMISEPLPTREKGPMSALGWIRDENLTDEILVDPKSFNPNKYEEKIIRKIFQWPKIIESAAYKLEPHKIPFYLYELSTLFHSYWSKGNEDKRFRFIENGQLKRSESLAFIYLIAIVIRNGMSILGVSLPEKM